MDIHPSYSCLLGRPWIHNAGDVTSMLHQMLKYPIQGKIITVHGEEEYMTIHLNSQLGQKSKGRKPVIVQPPLRQGDKGRASQMASVDALQHHAAAPYSP